MQTGEGWVAADQQPVSKRGAGPHAYHSTCARTRHGLCEHKLAPASCLLALGQAQVVQRCHGGRAREPPLAPPPIRQAHGCEKGGRMHAREEHREAYGHEARCWQQGEACHHPAVCNCSQTTCAPLPHLSCSHCRRQALLAGALPLLLALRQQCAQQKQRALLAPASASRPPPLQSAQALVRSRPGSSCWHDPLHTHVSSPPTHRCRRSCWCPYQRRGHWKWPGRRPLRLPCSFEAPAAAPPPRSSAWRAADDRGAHV